ncbi:MAG: hypothetical protein GC150_14140 [Rhizobiales bacterium]|nr:hypothetical protein [Hyphomicrobiales bacterium]
MSSRSTVGRLMLSLVCATTLTMTARAEQDPPTCKGRNLVAEMAVNDPAAHGRVMAAAEAMPNAGALFWRIERPGVAPSHLLGTIHLTDPRVRDLPAAASAALAAADQVVLEAVGLTDERMAAAMMNIGEKVLFTDGRTLSEFVTEAEASKLAKIVEANGMPAALAPMLKPWLLTALLSVPECEKRRTVAGIDSLDGSIEQSARDRGLEPVGLETPEEQLTAMADIDLESQVAWMRASLVTFENAEDGLESLIGLYLDRRIGGIWELTRHMMKDSTLEIDMDKALRGFQIALIDRRNRVMVERLDPILEKGNAFIGVGALHLPADVGIVAMLRERGWTVTPAE